MGRGWAGAGITLLSGPRGASRTRGERSLGGGSRRTFGLLIGALRGLGSVGLRTRPPERPFLCDERRGFVEVVCLARMEPGAHPSHVGEVQVSQQRGQLGKAKAMRSWRPRGWVVPQTSIP